MTERPDLQALGAELQAELRLLDWQVTYAYVADLCAEDGSPVYGLCNRLVDNKTATILIRDPLASQPLPEGAEDKPVESVLMHELVHLHLAPLAVNTPQGITAEEQAVWPLAEALTKFRGTARGDMLARAMQSRAQRITTKRSSRNMNRSELAMIKAAMAGEDPKAALASAKAALDAYEKAMPEEGAAEPDGDEAKAKTAAARAAEVDDAEKKDREATAKARAAETCPPKAAVATMTIADVDARAATIAGRIVSEHAERSALIEKNRAHLGENLATSLATQPLAQVKTIVAARLLDAPAPPPLAGTQRGARAGVGPLGPMPSDPLAGVPAEHRAETAAAVQRVARAFGLETDKRPAVEITSRGMSLSNVGSIREQYEELVRVGQAAVQQKGG